MGLTLAVFNLAGEQDSQRLTANRPILPPGKAWPIDRGLNEFSFAQLFVQPAASF
jgi:hypothetical protein